jgi:maltooligosyltrehalose synthase
MTDDGDGVIVVVPRFVSPLLDPLGALLPAGWCDTKVPVPAPFKGRSVTDRLSGRQSIPASDWLAIEETLGDVPAAVLVT